MNRASTYLFSLFLSVLLVFSILGASLSGIIQYSVTADMAITLSQENALEQTVYDSLDKYYKDRYYTTGIPAEVYMDNIELNWIRELIESNISDGFELINGHEPFNKTVSNDALESSIRTFFSDYADSVGAKKDAEYEKKVDKAIENAYTVINSTCDVFKIRALQSHGVFSKISSVFTKIPIATMLMVSAALVLILLLMLFNHRDTSYVLYWAGVSAIVAGIIGAVPFTYLMVTKYFDSFSIKQPQIYTAYTSAMYKFTSSAIAAMIAVIAIGIAILVLYSVVWSFKEQTKETQAIKNTKIN